MYLERPRLLLRRGAAIKQKTPLLSSSLAALVLVSRSLALNLLTLLEVIAQDTPTQRWGRKKPKTRTTRSRLIRRSNARRRKNCGRRPSLRCSRIATNTRNRLRRG
uniref:(northern house mosquito) hypothetical protein n=1 Tax=Culex pipiens TaxID=7175 RepID=A0A8D8GD83_CULPI